MYFFFYLESSKLKTGMFFSWKSVCFIISFCDIDFEITLKGLISFESHWFLNSLFCEKITTLNFYSMSHSNRFHSWWTVSIPSIRVLIFPNFKKSSICKNFSGHSNIDIPTTIRLIWSIKTLIRSLTIVEDDSVEKLIFVTLPIIFPTIRKFKKSLMLWYCFDSRAHNSQ